MPIVCRAETVEEEFPLLKTSPFVAGNTFSPCFGYLLGRKCGTVESYKNRLTSRFRFTRFGIDDPLCDFQTFIPDTDCRCLNRYFFVHENRR